MLVGTLHFRRSLQLDDYSCGSRSVYAVLKHFGIFIPHRLVKAALKTNPNTGTTVWAMIRLLRHRGLRVGYWPELSWPGLLRAFARGAIAVVHLDSDHIAVAHAASRRHVFLADPSFLRCPGGRITKERFLRERWHGWALLVSRSSASTNSHLRRGVA